MATTETKSAFTEKMQGMRRDAEGEIKKMEAQIAQTKADARAQHEQNMKELRSKMAVAQTKLQQVQSANEADWEMTRADAERSWSEVKQSIQKAASQLQNG